MNFKKAQKRGRPLRCQRSALRARAIRRQ